jgi:dipeptidyl aminopeptidase/acylaminoacyl peptidase
VSNKFAPLLLTLLPLSLTAIAAPLVPVEHFTEEAIYSNPRIAPDGKHIALNIRMMRNGRMIPTMSIFTLPALKSVSTIALQGFEIPMDFVWVSNKRLAVQKGIEVGVRVAPKPTGEVVAVNLDGTQSQYLYGFDNYKQSSKGERYGDDHGYATIAHIPEARDGHVLLSSYGWDAQRSMVYDVDSVSSSRRLLADVPFEGLRFRVQHNGVPRFATGVNDANNPVLFRLDDATGKWGKVEMQTQKSRYYPIGFSADDSSVYMTHSPNGAPYVLLKEEMSTGKRTVLSGEDIGDLDNIQYSAKPVVPFAVTSDVGIPVPRYLDENHQDAKLHKTLSAAFPGAAVNFINFTDDGKFLLFGVASDRDPGSYYLYDRSTTNASLLFSNMENIVAEDMAERRPFTFKARDGVTITGYLTLPANPGKAKLPMVLLPHGGPFGIKDDWYFDTDAQFLASRGYAVLQVNFRGSGGRGESFEASGYRQFGTKIMDDLIDGVKWANALPDIDAKRVCVYGISFGGYAALMLPVREPAMFKCSVGYSGQYLLHSRFSQDRYRGDKGAQNYLITTMGSDKATLDAQSPALLAAKIKVPVMLVHGGNDKTTELGQAEVMRDALAASGNPAEWILEKDEGHGFYDAKRRKEFFERLEAFLGKHIGK